PQRLRYLEQTQWRSADEISALQAGELRRLLRHAYANVPFYRERLESVGLHPDDVRTAAELRKLPGLTRDEAARYAAERTPRSDPRVAIRKTTGGSTGQPLTFGYDLGSEHWRQAIKLRGYGWAGYRMGDRTLHYWGAPIVRASLPVRGK